MKETSKVPVKASTEVSRFFNPFALLDELRTEMEQRWGRPWLFRGEGEGLTPSWHPTVDVFEKGGKLVVKADLPGMKKEDIQVTLDNGDLILKGERKTEHEVEEKSYYRAERSFGSFFRRMPIPYEIDPAKVEAKFHDGVLEILMPIPKESRPKPQKINVV